MGMEYMFITNRPEVAGIVDEVGIDRAWIDLERNGKEARQKGYNSVKSKHRLEDISRVKRALKKSKLQVRINPISSDSSEEIEKALAYGADFLMLPYYKTLKEVETFLSLVKSRASTILLLETKEADMILNETLQYPEIKEIHIGLNDLHLSYKKKFMFELLADGTVESICDRIKKTKIPFGFGGIAALGQGALPAEFILAEHFRLSSTRAILSRSFCDLEMYHSEDEIYRIMKKGIDGIRGYEGVLEKKDGNFFCKNHEQLRKRVEEIVYDSR